MQDIFQNSLRLIIEKFVLGIPNLIMAVILAIIGFLVAKAVHKLIKTVLRKLGVDKFGEMFNEIELIRQNNFNIKISSIISGFIYYLLLLIFLIAATDVLQMEALSNLVQNTIEFIPNLLVAIIIVVAGLLFADKMKSIVVTTCKSLGIPSAQIIGSFVFYFIFITVFIMALSQASIDTDFLSQNLSIIIGGIVLAFSIGYGLASKDLIGNYIAAFSTKNKFKVGETIKVDGMAGKIIDLDKTSVILENDQERIIIPINKILNQSVSISK